MAVIRDYLITQFTFYGLSVFTNQLKSFADAISEIALNRQLQKANISLETFRARSAMLAGDFSFVSSQTTKINSELQRVLKSADKLQTTLAGIKKAQLPVSAQNSYDRLVSNLDKIRNLSADAIASFSKGDFQKAQKYIERLSTTLDSSTKSLRNIQRAQSPTLAQNSYNRLVSNFDKIRNLSADVIASFSKGDFQKAQKYIERLNTTLDSSTKSLRNIQRAQLPTPAQNSYNRLVSNLDRMRNLSADAIASFSKGDFQKAQKYIERLNTTLDSSTKSLRNIQRYSTAQRFGAKASAMKSDLAKIISDFTSFNLKIGSMGLEKVDKQTIQTISGITELTSRIKRFLLPSVVGFAVTAVSSFFMVSRAIYNVTENIRDAYRLAIDLGIGIKGSLALARSLNMFGFDVNVISQSTMKLSEAITKNQLAGRLMLGWLGLSPYQLQGKDTLEALDTVLDRIMRLPSVSLRKTIGKELLGERFPELLMMKEMGYLDTIRQLNARYTEDYIKKVMQTAKAWAIVKMNIQDIGINLANNILPLVNQLVVFTNYLAENSQVLFGIITGLGILFTALKKPLIGVPMIFLGIAGLINSFKSESNNNLTTIANELRAQTRIMDLQYRTLNTIRLQLNQFIATTVRQTPNLYQASIYRSLLTNTGGI